MHSDQQPSALYICAFCSGQTCRIIVKGQTSRQQAAGHGEVSMEDYACTNRGHGKFFQVVECTKCRLRALYPLPQLDAIEQAYTKVKDNEYLTIEPSREIAFTKLLKLLERYVKPPGTLLDVGCYTGVFPLMAKRVGWDAHGIEPSVWASDIAQQRLPGKIKTGYLAQASWPEASFDVITSWDVIEHVTDPRREIGLMVKYLKPGGWLFLSTMDSQAPIVSLLGSRWPWYMPMHLFYFTPSTLGAFVKEVGLTSGIHVPYPHYTTLQYAVWKLEPYLGPIARGLESALEKFGLSKKVIKVDLGDFFLLACQKGKM